MWTTDDTETTCVVWTTGDMIRPATLLSVLVFQEEGGSIANDITEGRGRYCRDSGKGVGDFIFGKLTVILTFYILFI